MNELYEAANGTDPELLQAAIDKVSNQDVMGNLDMMKRKGNQEMRQRNYPDALISYQEALQGAIKIKHAQHAKEIYSNISLAYYQMSDFNSALHIAKLCISVDDTWVKAYYRMGKAYLGMKEYTKARLQFEKVLELSPGNKDAQKLLDQIDNYDNLVEREGGFNPITVAIEHSVDSDFYKSDEARLLHRFLLDYANVEVVCNQVKQLDNDKFNKHFWEALVSQDNTVSYGTCLGRLTLINNTVGVERYLSVANLANHIYQQNKDIKMDSVKLLCNKYNKMKIEHFDFTPTNIVFADWDHSCLGTGWYLAKKHANENILAKGGSFFPEKITLWVELVDADFLQDYWSPVVEVAPTNIDRVSERIEIEITEPDDIHLEFNQLTGKKCAGVIFGYYLSNGKETHSPSENGFVALDRFEINDLVSLPLSIQENRLVFGNNTIVRDSHPIPLKMLSDSKDPIKYAAYADALDKLDKKDGMSYYDPICGVGNLCKIMEDKLPETASIVGCDYHPTAIQIAKEKVTRCVIKKEQTVEWISQLPSPRMAVFDIFNSTLIGDGLLQLLPLLKHNGDILPQNATIHAQLVQQRSGIVDGVDLSWCNQYRWSDKDIILDKQPFVALSEPFDICTIDFNTVESKAQEYNTFKIPVIADGVASAISYWFTLDLGNDCKLVSKDCNWKKALQYLPECHVKVDETLSIECEHNGTAFIFKMHTPDNPLDIPRVDNKLIKQKKELDAKLQNMVKKIGWDLEEKQKYWQAGQKLVSAPGSFNLETTSASRMLMYLM